jgi:hypothetical protein
MAETGFDTSPGFVENTINNVVSNVAGVFSTRPNAKFMSGARCTLKINGKLVGFAFAINWNINTTYTEVTTVDDYLAYELAPQRVTVDGSISALHVPGTSATTQGWQSDILSFLFAPYVSIEARDSATNQVIFSTDKAVIVSRSEDIRVDSLSQVTLRWKAIGFIDEKTPAPPNNYNEPNNTRPGSPPTPVTRQTNLGNTGPAGIPTLSGNGTLSTGKPTLP